MLEHALNTAIAVLSIAQVLSQSTPTNWTRSAAHLWLQHLSRVTPSAHTSYLTHAFGVCTRQSTAIWEKKRGLS